METTIMHGDQWQVLTGPVQHPLDDDKRGVIMRHERTGLYRMRTESGRLIAVPEDWAKRFHLALSEGNNWTAAERVALSDVVDTARERAHHLARTSALEPAILLAQSNQVDADERGDVAGRCWWELIELELLRIQSTRPAAGETAHLRAARS